MKNQGNLSTWSYWELLKEERKWGKYDMNATEVRAEIERRREHWKTLAMWIGIPGGVIAAIVAVANFVRSSH
ncbi:hypothetical protein SSBR45G_34790 [Bradyrhizobium sp. SSBR45G]|uniref:hypothetical protein n=1 Tax=unclassified Bradyrhizobium TaxID=2631580 RepID=UPI002342AC62|nr:MULTISPECIES: hypothetical protein [unclassified Bradyrhizobium]GLH78570.1 hypothetical protein SSBR45G_34790 [Bradyrhizobium sp. SSBR45G]GLH86354.1 hypothetical protein SSBR45R_38140 [Bradyrhizobium sp. SSBR45R]